MATVHRSARADLDVSIAAKNDAPAPGTREAYRRDIDGLRALAVLLVVAYHAWPTRLRGGYLGVDVFFVISGYLIAGIIASELRNGTFSFVRFYERRARRLLPALVVVLPVAVVLGWYILLPEEFRLLGRQIVGAMFFVSNLVLMAEAGYFDTAAETKPLLHLWSLGVEEQFYLTFPFLLFVVHRRGGSMIRLIAFIGAASLASHAILDAINPTAAFYLPLTRAWELMAGALLAETAGRRTADLHTAGGQRASLRSIVGIATLVAGVLWAASDGVASVLVLLLVVCGTVLLIWAGPSALINRRLLSLRLLVGIGLISYPLYLWHWLLLASLREYFGHEGASPYIWAAIGLAVVLAWATYEFVERPVRRRLLGDRRWMGALAVAAMMVVVAGGVVWGREGFTERVAPRVRALAEFAKSPHEPYRNDTCETQLHGLEGLNIDACLSSSPAAPSIVLLGDSHANQYYKSLVRKLPATPVLHVGRWSCLPFSSKTHQTEDCQRTVAQMRDYITSERSISTVIVAGYWDYLMAGRFADQNADFREAAPLDQAETAVFLTTGGALVDALVAAGKRVVLFLDVPNLNFNIQQCIYDPGASATSPRVPPGCAFDRRDFEKRNDPYEAVMNQFVAAHPAVTVFDPRTVLCDAEVCHATQDGRALYFDSDHLSVRGADLVIERALATGVLP